MNFNRNTTRTTINSEKSITPSKRRVAVLALKSPYRIISATYVRGLARKTNLKASGTKSNGKKVELVNIRTMKSKLMIALKEPSDLT